MFLGYKTGKMLKDLYFKEAENEFPIAGFLK